MAQHWTSTQIQAVMTTEVENLYPYQLKALMDALDRVPHTESPDGTAAADAGAAGGEELLSVIFPSPGLNP